MKLKSFLNMTSCKDDYITITKNNDKIYSGQIEDYLKNKKSINGTVTEWFMHVENWDYPVLNIIIE